MLEAQNNIYQEIKQILQQARNKVYITANTAMVEAHWQIRKNNC